MFHIINYLANTTQTPEIFTEDTGPAIVALLALSLFRRATRLIRKILLVALLCAALWAAHQHGLF